ncbi:hypothetical protein GTQ40_13565 [Flavobacteriaceae bacterium R38]|nr:hypothetical protein [Flavobacteriaceae bacterium R38]
MESITSNIKRVFFLLFTLTLFIGCEEDDENLPAVTAAFTFTINQDTGVVTFINISENAESFEWNFGNGTTSLEINPIRAFQNGTFTVSLEASNVAGASAVFEDQITISMPVSGFNSGLLVNGDFSNGGEGWTGNALNVQTEGDNSFNFANVESAGNPFDVNLSQVVEIVQGTNYILTFDASSDRERTILAGIGLNEAPFTNTAPSVNLTTETQTFSLQLSAVDFGNANSRVLFDMGAEVGTVVLDNISLVEGGDGSDSTGGDTTPPFDSGLLTNGDFEAGADPWTIGVGTDPVPVVTEDGNTFYQVDVTTAGNAFDVNMSQRGLSLTNGTTFTLTFDAWTDETTGSRDIIAGIGRSGGDFANVSETVTITSTRTTYTRDITVTFDEADGRVLFDSGAAIGQVNIDNVSLVVNDTPPPSFDSGLLTNGDFEAGADPWTIGVGTDPVPVVTEDGNTFYQVDVATAGNPFDVNMSQRGLSLTNGTTFTLTFDAWTDETTGSRDIIAGIGRSGGDFANVSETVTITSTRATYTRDITVTFDEADGRVLFDSGAAIGQVNIDNVSLVVNNTPPPPFDSGLLTNGDYEAGADPWTIGVGTDPVPVVTEDGNTFYQVDVTTAGNPFDVNMSQRGLSLTNGMTFTLTFDAWTDETTGSRDIVAGIGRSGGDFANVSETVTITSTRATYTRDITVTFDEADGRVLFDSGAAIGQVNIDNVSLFVDGGSSGGGCTATPIAATSIPLNFEGCETFLSTFTGAGTITSELAANPSVGGINTSSNVMRVVRSGTQRFAGVQNSFPAGALDTSTSTTNTSTFRIRVFSTIPDVVYRFELALDPQTDPVTGNPAPVFSDPVPANQWVELEIVFINLPATANTYNQFVIKPDNPSGSDGEIISADQTFYFDDFRIE